MIESFTIKNYMCYREETEFSFVASKKEGKKNSLPPSWYKEIVGKRILTANKNIRKAHLQAVPT